jgi:hypothetical protein
MGISNVNDHVTQRSTHRAADGTVVTGPCRVYYVALVANGSNDVEVTLYDNTAASGDDRIQINALTSAGRSFNFGQTGVYFSTGLHIAASAGFQDLVVTYAAE